MKIEPVGHRILIKLDAAENISKGGIHLGDDQRREQRGMESGVVVALGPTAYADFSGEPWVKVGDTVNFKRYEGDYKEVDGEHFRILNDEDILCKTTK